MTIYIDRSTFSQVRLSWPKLLRPTACCSPALICCENLGQRAATTSPPTPNRLVQWPTGSPSIAVPATMRVWWRSHKKRVDPNVQVQPPGRLDRLHTLERRNAGPVRCNGSFGLLCLHIRLTAECPRCSPPGIFTPYQSKMIWGFISSGVFQLNPYFSFKIRCFVRQKRWQNPKPLGTLANSSSASRSAASRMTLDFGSCSIGSCWTEAANCACALGSAAPLSLLLRCQELPC